MTIEKMNAKSSNSVHSQAQVMIVQDKGTPYTHSKLSQTNHFLINIICRVQALHIDLGDNGNDRECTSLYKLPNILMLTIMESKHTQDNPGRLILDLSTVVLSSPLDSLIVLSISESKSNTVIDGVQFACIG